jgi:molecular chaperone GrpE
MRKKGFAGQEDTGFEGRERAAEENPVHEQRQVEDAVPPAGDRPAEQAGFSAGRGEADGSSGPAGADEAAAAPDQRPWEKEIEELTARLQQKHDELLRKQADFDNYRRISKNEKEEVREYALSDFFKKLLPVLDNMERALESARQGNVASSYVEGLEMIQKQLLTLLDQEGVTVIECVGKPFDPNFHHAVLQEEGEGEADLVAAELQRGYMHKKRLLRPSMVKVCRG